MPPNAIKGTDNTEKFYFDINTGTCRKLVYSGGYGNHFDTMPKCEQTCICPMQHETGPCMALMERFYFDMHSATCKNFTHGGCKGNGNNFETEQSCNQICKVANKV